MKLLFTLLLFNMTATAALAQTPGVQWQVNSKENYDAFSTLATSDSGLIVASNDLFKLNKDGLLQWKIPLTADSSFYYELKPASDGNYFLFGDTPYDSTGSQDIRIMKFSRSGTVLWDQTVGGSATEDFRSALATSDGGCIVLGRTNSNDGDIMLPPNQPYDFYWSDCWILKLDATGLLEWERTFGGIGQEEPVKVVKNGSGGYVVAYHQADSNDFTYSGYHAKLLNLDGFGNSIWKKTYADSTSFTDLINIPGGGYMLAGGTYQPETFMDSTSTTTLSHYNIWLAKLNPNGDLIWENNYGDNRVETYQFLNVHPLANGNYAIAGSVNRFRRDTITSGSNSNVSGRYEASDAFLLNIDGSGNLLFKKAYVGGNSESASLKVQTNNEQLLCITTSSSDGYFAGGYNQPGNADHRDVWLIKLDAGGNALWKKLFGGANDDYAVVELLHDDQIF